MTRLIDKDKLKGKKMIFTDNDYCKGWNDAIDTIIENEPEIMPEELEKLVDGVLEILPKLTPKMIESAKNGELVVKTEERPRGEWIDTGNMEEYWAEEYLCSICGTRNHWHNFCPFCGADMREADNEQ